VPTYTTAFTVNRADLEFILKQIKIAEATSIGYTSAPKTTVQAIQEVYGVSAADAALLPYGLRTVDGSDNSLLAGQSEYGAADNLFPRLTDPVFRDDADGDEMPLGPPGSGAPTITNTDYGTPGSVADADPRIISNLIVDMSINNPAAIEAFFSNELAVAAFEELHGKSPVRPGEPLPADGSGQHLTSEDLQTIPNISPDVGLTASFNSWMTFFGQFFDHGLDLVTKGNNGTVYIPLEPGDPLYVEGSPTNFMVLTRATPTYDENGVAQHTNTTTSFVDQNQTYTSHPSHQVFLREYVKDADGNAVATGRLIDGQAGSGSVHGAPGNWAEVKAQALEMLGIALNDFDVHNVPLLLTDQYGKFIPGANGYAQLVMAPDETHATNWLKEGTAEGISTAGSLKTNHAFLDDIAHHAAPAMVDHDHNPATARVAQTADVDVDLNGDGVISDAERFADDGNALTYDDEMLGSHFITGDGRGNENAALTTVHSIFHSEHNRLVDANKATILATGDMAFINEWLVNDLLEGDPLPTDINDPALSWDGERLFQSSRFVTEMQYQHLVFEEFARRIQPNVDPFVFNNNPEVDPSIVAEFAHTVYRFGHSMLTGTVDRLDNNLDTLGGGDQSTLLQAFLNPQMYLGSGDSIGEINANFIRGLSRDVGNEIDEFIVTDVRSNLLGLPLDLAALNIARGRDTGVPSLNETRQQLYEAGALDLKPYTSWVDYAANIRNPMSIVNFIAAYGTHASLNVAGMTYLEKRTAAENLVFGVHGIEDIPENAAAIAAWRADRLAFMNGTGSYAGDKGGLDNVDLWIGGLAEEQFEFGGMLGQTFNWIFEYQMESLQFGDRLYYLTRTQGMNLLNQLEPNTFTDLIMRNTDLGDVYSTHLSGSIFVTPDLFLELDRGIAQASPDPEWAEDEPHPLLQDKVTRIYDGTQVVDENGVVHDVGGTMIFHGGEHIVVGGTEGDDSIWTDLGDDTLWGDGGNDYLNAGAGADNVFGGDGDDIIEDPLDDDVLRGEGGNDVIAAARGLDLLFGGTGNDYIQLGQDASEAFAGEGDDFVLGGAGGDFLLGNEGDDWMEGAGGFDTLAGDNSELFFNSELIGHDVLFGHGDETDYDAESGDDIMGSAPSVFRYEGMFGFDWAIAKYDLTGVDFDMSIPFFTTDQQDVLRDRFDLVEAFSGWKYDDRLVGDDRGRPLGGLDPILEFDNHVLDEEGIARIDGMGEWLGLENGGDSALDTLFGAGTTTFRDGNILMGGAGNDLIQGRGGFDIIDGDSWLNVRIAIHARNPDGSLGAELYTAESLTTETAWMGPYAGKVFAAGTDLSLPGPHTPLFNGRSLQSLLKDGTINPGQLKIVRELKQEAPEAADVDTAVYQGTLAEYEIEGLQAVAFDPVTGAPTQYRVADLNGDGFISVRDLDNGLNGAVVIGPDGLPLQLESRGVFTDDTDLLRGIERLQFADQAITIDGDNEPATGTVTIVDATSLDGLVTPHVGQVLSATVSASDADGLPAGLPGLSFQWQVSIAGESPSWVTVSNGLTYTVQPGDLDKVIRAVAIFQDAEGVTERLYSAPTLKPQPTFSVDENSTAGALVATLPFDIDADAHDVDIDLDLATVYHEIDPAFTGDGRFTIVQNGLDADFNPIWEIQVAPGAPALDYEALQSPVDNQYTIVVNTYDVDPAAGGTVILRREFTILLNNLSETNATGAAVIVDTNGGSIREGDTLTVDTSGIADPDGLGGLTHRWQYLSDGGTWEFIPGAIGASLTLLNPPGTALSDLAGRQLRVVTSFVDGTGQVERVTSAASQPVGVIWNGGPGVDSFFAGTAGGDVATAGNGDDILDGGAGEDVLAGGGGDDQYVVREAGDVVIETADGGVDGVSSYALIYTLADNVENLSLFGGAVTGIGNDQGNWIGGNDLANVLVGAGGDDVLIGGAGADAMAGGTGSDGYVVDEEGDTISESVGEGIDWVNSHAASYTLAANVENAWLVGPAVNLTGNDLDNQIYGNANANTLNGGGGNDILDGGAGVDTLAGGTGDDQYGVDDAGDVVVEAPGAGVDTVSSYAVTYTLTADVENLSLFGAAVTGIGNDLGNWIGGNELANVLVGNGGDDVLIGGAGADNMSGGTGSDGYVVDDAGDTIVEGAGEGIDWVNSYAASYTLGANVENAWLVGPAISLTGNDEANQIYGNGNANTLNGGGGDDILDGGVGADTMAGGTGNDQYGVDDAGDVVAEAVGEGVDTVSSYIASYTLTDNVENLSLFGAAVNGTGNELDNWIGGNDSANVLSGLGGNDVLIGGGGDDVLDGGAGDDLLVGGLGQDDLTGGDGADSFAFDSAADAGSGVGRDVIADFLSGTDKIQLSAMDASSINAGDDAFAFIGEDAFTAAGQLRASVVDGVTVVEGDLDGDLVADFQLALVGAPAVVATDFIL
jgi:Ca2+-binding RTX toxin-like protein